MSLSLPSDGGIAAKLDEVIGFSKLGYDGGQVAFCHPGGAPRRFPHEPYIDGLPAPFNGVPAGTLVINFTALMGIYLNSVRANSAILQSGPTFIMSWSDTFAQWRKTPCVAPWASRHGS